MFTWTKRLILVLATCCAAFAVAVLASEDSTPKSVPPDAAGGLGATTLKSQVVRFEDAASRVADWGEFRRYFSGETFGTKNVLTAVAIVEPGKAVHRAHRHAEEEYLVVVEGAGTWSLDGKEFPAQRGDILYVEPWVYHGLTNTGDERLIFLVVRFNSKGVAVPPQPDDRPNEL